MKNVDPNTGEIPSHEDDASVEATKVRTISEKFLFGDLLKFMVGELKQMSIPWGALPEKDQQRIIDRLQERTASTVREVVEIIAGKARPTVQASIESVLFKDGVKVTLTFSKFQVDRHAIADASGGAVLLVLPDYEAALGGDAPKADKDQAELFVILFEDEIRKSAKLLAHANALVKEERGDEAGPLSEATTRAIWNAIDACSIALHGADNDATTLMLSAHGITPKPETATESIPEEPSA